jgi:putative transcriptional regulator
MKTPSDRSSQRTQQRNSPTSCKDAAVLAANLAPAGIATAQAQRPRSIDVRALRHRLGLSREQFATRFGLEVETLRNWEIGRREPDTTARSYLHAIANDPERVEHAYALPWAASSSRRDCSCRSV